MSKHHTKPDQAAATKLLNILHSRAWDSRNKRYGWTPHPGQVKVGKSILVDGKTKVFLQCGRKWGKCLSIDTLLLTPSGPKRIGDIKEGDTLFGSDGLPCKVIGVADTKFDTPCFDITFNDGTKVTADADHKWKLINKHGTIKTLTTQQWVDAGINNYRIPLNAPVEFSQKQITIDPYLLGAWLGDGTSKASSITTADPEILASFCDVYEQTYKSGKYTYGFKGGFLKQLQALKLIGNKHIPDNYLYSCYLDRILLLQGLMDTDGTVDKRGVVEFVQKRRLLFEQTLWLIRSLGVRAYETKPKVIKGVKYYRFRASPNLQVFNLPRKAERLAPHLNNSKRKTKGIKTITKVNSVPVKCLSVNSSDNTYLLADCTVTHNTEFVIYILLRWAILNPGSTCAYFGDKRVNAKKIIWKRLKTFIPQEFLLEGSVERAFKEQELCVRLWNGSEILVDGTQDEDSGRGVEPNLVVYDEYKDHKEGFHRGMEPNLEVNKAVVVFIGTPPDHENHFTEMAEEIRNDPEGFYIEAPSSEGPVYGTTEGLKRLKKLRDKYTAMGDLSYYKREYEAKFVLGGTGAVFPMWDRKKHTLDSADIKAELSKDLGRMEWYVVTDPGTTTCHATLITCLNPYTKKLYILDEIYETRPEETSTRRIWPRIEALMVKWAPHLPISDSRWYKGYDEAAAWFAMEVQDSFGNIGLSPTNKRLSDKENGISLIKDQMLEGRVVISTSCEKLIWEIERYVKDSNGKLPKKNDHALDVWRYINAAANYQFSAYENAPDPFKERGWRAVRPADEYDLADVFDDYDFTE